MNNQKHSIRRVRLSAGDDGVVQLPNEFQGKFGFLLPARINYYNIPNSDETRCAITLLQNGLQLSDVLQIQDIGKLKNQYTVYDIYGSYAQKDVPLDYLVCIIELN